MQNYSSHKFKYDYDSEIDSYYGLTSSRSKVHNDYYPITYGEILSRFHDVNFDHNDYETCVDLANVITHVINNGKIEDAYTGVDDDSIKTIGDFITSCDSNILKKGSPIKIASEILQLISKNDKLTKEQVKEMIERSITQEQAEKQQEENQEDSENQDSDDNSDKQEDSENQDEKEGKDKDGSEESDQEGQDGKKQKGKDQGDGEEEDGNDEQDGKGKGSGEKESDKEEKGDKDGNKGKPGNGDKENQSPLLQRMKLDAPIDEIKKFVEVREISDSYNIPMNGILDYRHLNSREVDFINKLAIIESRGKLKAKKIMPKEEIDLMNEYSQVSRIRNKTEMLYPTFGYKFATKNLMVKRHSFPTKQALCLLIDDSGSMNCTYKVDWVKAILWNRALEAESNNMDLYCALFESQVYEIQKINSLDEAKNYYKKIGFNGGGTDVQGCTEYMMEWFKVNHISAQVVIINDGQDVVNKNWQPSEDLHAIMLGAENHNLKEVITKKDGHYEVFNN
jgi:uncharacterized protein with von Willebrand factor type A (vWA) domain